VACGDHAVGERSQVVEGDPRCFGIQPPQHIADDAHGARAAESLQPAELAVGLLYGFEFEPDRGARAFESLLRNPPVIEANRAQATQPTDRLSSSRGLKPSPITTSVDPPPMSMTSRLSGLMGLV